MTPGAMDLKPGARVTFRYSGQAPRTGTIATVLDGGYLVQIEAARAVEEVAEALRTYAATMIAVSDELHAFLFACADKLHGQRKGFVITPGEIIEVLS